MTLEALRLLNTYCYSEIPIAQVFYRTTLSLGLSDFLMVHSCGYGFWEDQRGVVPLPSSVKGEGVDMTYKYRW